MTAPFTSFTARSASALAVYAANANPLGLRWKSRGTVRSHTNPAFVNADRISSSVALNARLRIITRQLFGLAPSHPPSCRAHSTDAKASTPPKPTPPEFDPARWVSRDPAPSLSLPRTFCALRLPTPGMDLCSAVTALRATASEAYTTTTTPRVAPSCLSFAASTTSFGAGDRTSSTCPHARAASRAASGSIPSGSPAKRRPAMATERAARVCLSAG
mmetsp:Transcript_3077/g.12312  ORF Transcript_3077/g.12312 Transcript_3077/m.12312 type:complete len:217 (+) Transcript_3077:1667-2317(+)